MAREKIFRGERLREARKDAELNQDELAEAIGASAAQISRYETGESQPTPQVTVRLAEVLKTSIDWLYGLSIEKKGHYSQSEMALTPMEKRLVEAYRNGDLREMMKIASEK